LRRSSRKICKRLNFWTANASPAEAAHGILDQLNWKMEPEPAAKEARFSLANAERLGIL
jgi:hypothetical protein